MHKKVNRKFTYNEFEKGVFRYIKNNLQDDLLAWQNNQIFSKSQGKDKVQLGYYKKQKNQKRLIKKPNSISEGQPYDMIFTKRLKNNMKVKVTLSYIEFKSDTNHVFTIQSRDIWGTKEWFGLNDSNFHILKILSIEAGRRWINTKI